MRARGGAAVGLFHITAFVFAIVREVYIQLDHHLTNRVLLVDAAKSHKFAWLCLYMDSRWIFLPFSSPWHYLCCHPLSVQRALGVTMCDTLPPAPLSVRVRPSVWFGVGIRSQAHHDRHHQCLPLPAPAVLLSLKDCRALPRVTVAEILG